MKLKVGLIGAGGNTRLRHIPGFQSLKDVEIVAVANRTMESSEAVAKEHGIPVAYGNWRDLIDDPEIDAVCIGTWPYVHEVTTIAALESGKHVLCEARMASTLDEALAMHEAHQRHPDLVAQIVPSPFTLPYDKQLTEMVAGGEIGSLLTVDVIAQTHVPPEAPMSFRNESKYSGINTMTLGIYYEALVRWAGVAECVTAHSQLHTTHRKDGDELKPVTVPDHLEVLGRMQNGASLHMRFSSASRCTRNLITLVGTEGSLQLCADKCELSLSRDGRTWAPIKSTGGEWRVEEDFVDSIRDGKAVEHTSFQAGLQYMAFTEAVMESAAGGGTVGVKVF